MSYDNNDLEIERFQWVGKKIGFYGSVFIIALVSVFPILWMFITSLKQPGNVVAFPVEYIPRDPTLENYRAAIEGAPFFRYLLNSVIVATGTAVIDVLLGALAGYSLSRLRFRFKLPVLLLILGTAMLPFIARLSRCTASRGRGGCSTATSDSSSRTLRSSCRSQSGSSKRTSRNSPTRWKKPD